MAKQIKQAFATGKDSWKSTLQQSEQNKKIIVQKKKSRKPSSASKIPMDAKSMMIRGMQGKKR